MSCLRLVLARHGQTASNVRMALDSRPPGPPLTELGRRQAADLADALAADPVAAVYASTAVRAQQTAAAVAARHDLRVRVVDGVQEVYLGELDQRADEAAVACYVGVVARWFRGELDVPMPGGETGRQVLHRYGEVLDDVRRRHSGGVVVLVSHGAAIRLVAAQLAGNLDPARVEHALLPNVGRVVLDDDPDSPTGWRCVAWTGLDLA